jgi:transposase-like protein
VSLADELNELYWLKNKSSEHIAKVFGVKPSTILWWMRKFGIPRRPYSEANILRYLREPPVSSEKLRELYLIEKKSTRQIAKQLGMAQTSVRRWMTRYGISARNPWSPLKYPRTHFFGDEREKAYLLGLRAGDLSVCQRTPYTIEVTTASSHPAMIDSFL